MKNSIPYILPGVMHIHTRFSDGSGTVEEVVAAAREAGLRWIIISDHDSLGGKSLAGWHDDVLVLFGHEITPIDSHYMALNVDHVVSKDQAPQRFIDEVYAHGGFGIILHPDDHLEDRRRAIHPWKDWSVDGPAERDQQTGGLELWNVMSDWRSKTNVLPRRQLFESPQDALTGPTPAVLEWWDRLNMAGRRTFGTGGLDAHATREMHPDGYTTVLFPYQWMFGTVTNYLLLDAPLEADSSQAMQQVFTALRQGRSYFVNRLYGTTSDFPLLATRGDAVWHIGDSPTLDDGALTLRADGGAGTELRLIYNGGVLVTAVETLEQQIEQPGVYRLEGLRDGNPWLFTNPLFVQG
jgi:hypothetical protein